MSTEGWGVGSAVSNERGAQPGGKEDNRKIESAAVRGRRGIESSLVGRAVGRRRGRPKRALSRSPGGASRRRP